MGMTGVCGKGTTCVGVPAGACCAAAKTVVSEKRKRSPDKTGFMVTQLGRISIVPEPEVEAKRERPGSWMPLTTLRKEREKFLSYLLRQLLAIRFLQQTVSCTLDRNQLRGCRNQ